MTDILVRYNSLKCRQSNISTLVKYSWPFIGLKSIMGSNSAFHILSSQYQGDKGRRINLVDIKYSPEMESRQSEFELLPKFHGATEVRCYANESLTCHRAKSNRIMFVCRESLRFDRSVP